MDNILIDGGTGFVGSWMRKTQPQNVDAVYLSRRDYNNSWWMGKYNYVVHLANISPVSVIEYCRQNNSRLLYCSSGAVYHPENDTEYRRNKITWEQECLDGGIDVVTARLFTFYGDGLDDNKAVVQFKRAAQRGEPIRIWGDGETVRSYMHGSEMARWLWAILRHGKSREAYDVGDDKPVTMLQLARICIANKDPKPPIIIENGKDPMPVYLPEKTAKTKELLKT